jgi:hypothetical protein
MQNITFVVLYIRYVTTEASSDPKKSDTFISWKYFHDRNFLCLQSLTYVPMLSYFLAVTLFQFSCSNFSNPNLQIQYSLNAIHSSYCSLVRIKLLPGLIQKLRGTIYKYKWHRKGLKYRACHFKRACPV